jgi:quinol monooxygenase YgiN
MITRITKFQINPELHNQFSEFMNQFKDELNSVEGCKHFDVLQDKESEHNMFLFMIWEDDEFLEHFRKSELNKILKNKITGVSNDEPVSWTVETVFDPEEMKQQKSLFD